MHEWLVAKVGINTHLVNCDISDPSEGGSYILSNRQTISSSNFLAKILSQTCNYCQVTDKASREILDSLDVSAVRKATQRLVGVVTSLRVAGQSRWLQENK